MPKVTTNRGTITKAELLKRIRKMCLWCCGNQSTEVQECQSIECQLWDIRLGNRTPLSRPQRPKHEKSWVMPDGRTEL